MLSRISRTVESGGRRVTRPSTIALRVQLTKEAERVDSGMRSIQWSMTSRVACSGSPEN